MTMLIPTLCLNMIVKNESKIIVRMLDSVYEVINSYVICDTGSTDNTIELIHEYFQTKNVETGRQVFGMVIQEPFQNFGYNRTFALKACELLKQNADYILLMDADMKLQMNITPQEFKSHLTSNAFYMFQGNDGFFYKNIRIVKNYFNFTYWGTTHEYVDSPKDVDVGDIPLFQKEEVFILDVGDGGSKASKFERDIALLSKGLETLPNNDRYTFYLANSYMDSGDLDSAINTYKKRIDIGGWIEEVWYSYCSIARCYTRLGNQAEAINHYLLAFNAYPYRIENLYELVKYYRENEKYHLAYHMYKLADRIRTENSHRNDYLFWQCDVYKWRLDYEFSVLGYYANPDQYNLSKLSVRLASEHSVDEHCYKNILFNYKFYAPEIAKEGVVRNILVSSHDISDNFVQSTLTICKLGLSNSLCAEMETPNALCVGIRLVNYFIDEHGNYVNQDEIISSTILQMYVPLGGIREGIQHHMEWFDHPICEYMLSYDSSNDCRYKGPEDVRFFTSKDILGNECLLYNANRGINNDCMRIERGIVHLENKSLESCQILQKQHQGQIEKNWVMFQRKPGDDIHWVYKFSPLEIGTLSPENEFQPTLQIPSKQLPRFFGDLRGSTNGVNVNEHEIWFLCHLVSYEDRRFYYHIMVVLDVETMCVKSYSPLWTFEKQKVEYTLGFVYMEDTNTFLIGYSVLDKETKLLEISKSWFDANMILV